MKNFFSGKRSVVFLAFLVLLALASLWGGVSLQSEEIQAKASLSIFFMQLSGILFAAAVTTIFFSFPDVRRHLGQSLAILFSEGRVVGLLSTGARERLWRSLLEARLEETTLRIDDSLERRVRGLLDSSLAEFHRYNVVIRTTLSRCGDVQGYLLHETVSTYKVRADHLLGDPKTYKYQYLDEVTLLSGASVEKLKEVVEFRVRLGSESYTLEDLEIEECKIKEQEAIRCHFEKEVAINGELDIEEVSRSYVDERDPIHAMIVRYPTYGFSLTITFDDEHEYEGIWFSEADLNEDSLPGELPMTPHSNGVTAYTQGWVLPGDGVMISRTRKTIEGDFV